MPFNTSNSLPFGVQPISFGIGHSVVTTPPMQPVGSSIAGGDTVSRTVQKDRSARIAAFKQGPIALAPARLDATAYPVNAVFTRANGAQFIVTVAGTTAVGEPVGLVDGRPFVDGTVTGYFAGFVKRAADAIAPTIAQVAAAGLAAAGLAETRFASGVTPAQIVSSADGVIYNVSGAYVAITQAAVGTLLSGAGNAPVTSGFGVPVAIGGENLGNVTSCAEFIVEDTKFGLTCHNFGFLAIVLVDGQPVAGNGAIEVAAGAGNAVVFDFAGSVAPRRVSVYANNGALGNLRGVALTPQGRVYPVPRSGDVMLVLGDSYNTTVAPSTPVIPNMSYWLKNYLGLDGLVNMAVGGSGYVNAVVNTYNIPAMLASRSNQLLFPFYNPRHVLINTGGNDGSQPLADVRAAALASWRRIRQIFPNARITITDGNSGAAGPSANSIAVSGALQEQFALWSDDNSRFIPIVTGSAATAWVNGTGNVGQALAAGNSSLWTSTDGTHPSPGGAQYLGLRLSEAISRAWQGNY